MLDVLHSSLTKSVSLLLVACMLELGTEQHRASLESIFDIKARGIESVFFGLLVWKVLKLEARKDTYKQRRKPKSLGVGHVNKFL